MYESDHTKWMREMMAKNPEWAEDQRVGRAIWWDKQLDQDTQAVSSSRRKRTSPILTT